MRKTFIPAVGAAIIAGLAIAAPAQAAAAGTLTSGLYVTPAGKAMDLMPAYVPVAKPGNYKTTGRPKNKACGLRAVDDYGTTVAGVYLAKATSYTLRIPADAAIIEASGPCKWVRK